MTLLQKFAVYLRRLPVFQLAPNRNWLLAVHQGAAVNYRTQILNADGTIARPWSPWKRNLILDQGLNKIGNGTKWASVFSQAAVGTGTPVLRRDSGAVTFTQAGNTLTASAGFFVSGDVGKLFKWGTGTAGAEMYITGFTSATVVTVSVSATVGAPAVGTIWSVNLTGLVAEHARSGTYTQAGGDNGSSFAVDTWSLWRTFIFAAEAGPVTLTEIGWSENPAAGANLFGLDLIAGVGDSLLAGQQYKVQVRLTVTFSPATPRAVADVGNNGFVTAGNDLAAYVGNNGGINTVNADGSSTTNPNVFDMGGTGTTYLITTAFALPGASSTTNFMPAGQVAADTSNTWAAYTLGNFYRDLTSVFSIAVGNGNVYGLCIGPGNANASWCLAFTATQTKTSTNRITTVARFSWGRILTN